MSSNHEGWLDRDHPKVVKMRRLWRDVLKAYDGVRVKHGMRRVITAIGTPLPYIPLTCSLAGESGMFFSERSVNEAIRRYEATIRLYDGYDGSEPEVDG